MPWKFALHFRSLFWWYFAYNSVCESCCLCVCSFILFNQLFLYTHFLFIKSLITHVNFSPYLFFTLSDSLTPQKGGASYASYFAKLWIITHTKQMSFIIRFVPREKLTRWF